jgi:hypothetical protein
MQDFGFEINLLLQLGSGIKGEKNGRIMIFAVQGICLYCLDK